MRGNNRKDSRYNDELGKITGYKTESLLCMPIRNGDNEIVGVAQALNKNKEEGFSPDDEKFSSPTLSSTVLPSVLQSYPQFYSPTLSSTVLPSVLQSYPKFYSPTLSSTVLPSVLQSYPQFYSPTLNSTVLPSVLQSYPQFYSPTLSSLVLPSVQQSYPQFYSPTISSTVLPKVLFCFIQIIVGLLFYCFCSRGSRAGIVIGSRSRMLRPGPREIT
ncbi:hypothetical protein Btru_028469 [Bulinus truncatus]|nr:hypothetical protein Btru_028469 [Bulinus truncatus]